MNMPGVKTALPSISAVIAVSDSTEGLIDCLLSLARQRGERDEVIVVSSAELPGGLLSRFEDVTWIQETKDLSIPGLWARGLMQARGDVLAITTAHFLPAGDWVSAIRDAHSRLHSIGIGGPIDPPVAGSVVSWATYFLRYNRFLGHRPEQQIDDIAGDNASYVRSGLFHAALQDGFWEQEFHRRVLAQGKTLTFTPKIRVRQQASFRFKSFILQRFQHGRQFGRTRALRWPFATRLVAVLASPLIPPVFLSKIIVNVLGSRRHLVAFFYALPVLSCFLAAWSIGEICGYLAPIGKERG